jgi:ubiquinone/menaquinone biosynthesis C-methylase UbiE
MTMQAASDFYDRHWRRRMEKEKATPGADWSEINVIKLLMRHHKPRKILDVGCGIGHTLERLAAIPGVLKLYGIEPSPLAVEEARRRLPQAEIHQGFAEDMAAIPDGSCDTAVAAAVMEHIYDTHRVLNEINRILAPGGVVAVYTTDFNLLKKILVALFAFERCFDVCGGHIRFFTRRSLRAVMEEHGFEKVAQEWDAAYAGVMPRGQNAVFRKVREVRLLRETC